MTTPVIKTRGPTWLRRRAGSLERGRAALGSEFRTGPLDGLGAYVKWARAALAGAAS